MNDRIKDLALEVIVENIASEAWVFTNAELDKFAELIIRECFEVVIKDHRFSDCKGIIRGAGALAKQHFGVEE